MAHTFAIIRTRFTALHRWEDAPDDVDFLRDPHRHEFHVEVKIQQFHNDRDVEYIMAKRAIDTYIRNTFDGRDLGEKSCEMMAENIISLCNKKWGEDRFYEVEVTEDGENGALVIDNE
jgi:6-pyruvoyl-tetrahydropterin synthase